MTTARIPVQEWQQAMLEATRRTAAASLGYEHCEWMGAREQLPAETCGSYLPVISQENSIQLALVSDDAGCRRLAQALLGMSEGDELSSGDVADAVGEICNIIAGGVKILLHDKDTELKLGLPLFIHGHVQNTVLLESAVAEVKIGPVDAYFVVLRHRPPKEG